MAEVQQPQELDCCRPPWMAEVQQSQEQIAAEHAAIACELPWIPSNSLADARPSC